MKMITNCTGEFTYFLGKCLHHKEEDIQELLSSSLRDLDIHALPILFHLHFICERWFIPISNNPTTTLITHTLLMFSSYEFNGERSFITCVCK